MPDSGMRTCDTMNGKDQLIEPIWDEVWGELTSEEVIARCVSTLLHDLEHS